MPPQERNIKQHLLSACKEQKTKTVLQIRDVDSFKMTRWLVSERFQLLGCKTFKVGSRNTARTMYTLDHLSELTDPSKIAEKNSKHIAVLQQAKKTPENWKKQYAHYKKFMFVRDPLERLLSAYRDRRPREFFKLTPEGNFEDFLEWLLKLPEGDLNPHVVSFTKMCNPCGIEYDFIGTIDRYEQDMRNILESVGAYRYASVPHRNQTGYMKSKSEEVFQDFLQKLPKALIKKVYEKYYLDYLLFGFSKPKF